MKEEIYVLKEACATKETGAYFPQISKMNADYNFDADNSIHCLGRKYHNSIPDNEPNFNYFVMNSKSKLTDFLSCSTLSSWGFIVSSKTKVILESTSLPIHKFFPVTIFYKKEFIKSYYYIHIVSYLYERINFNESTFYIGDDSDNIIKSNIKFKNHDELLNSKREFQKENISNRIFKQEIKLFEEPEFDIFCIKGEFDSDIYIKQNLKNSFANSGITGFETALSNKIKW